MRIHDPFTCRWGELGERIRGYNGGLSIAFANQLVPTGVLSP